MKISKERENTFFREAELRQDELERAVTSTQTEQPTMNRELDQISTQLNWEGVPTRKITKDLLTYL